MIVQFEKSLNKFTGYGNADKWDLIVNLVRSASDCCKSGAGVSARIMAQIHSLIHCAFNVF